MVMIGQAAKLLDQSELIFSTPKLINGQDDVITSPLHRSREDNNLHEWTTKKLYYFSEKALRHDFRYIFMSQIRIRDICTICP